MAELELLLRGKNDRRKTLRQEAVVGGRLGDDDLGIYSVGVISKIWHLTKIMGMHFATLLESKDTFLSFL